MLYMKTCKVDGCESTDMATRSAMCKEHHREYTREHYKNNKQSYLDKNKRSIEETLQMLRIIKEASPCTDCGERYPYYVMDFDHLDGGTKLGNIRELITYGKQKVMAEIAKCELVCANCHRERTHKRTLDTTV